eukprot:4771153-Prymnesium_polylepis.2
MHKRRMHTRCEAMHDGCTYRCTQMISVLTVQRFAQLLRLLRTVSKQHAQGMRSCIEVCGWQSRSVQSGWPLDAQQCSCFCRNDRCVMFVVHVYEIGRVRDRPFGPAGLRERGLQRWTSHTAGCVEARDARRNWNRPARVHNKRMKALQCFTERNEQRVRWWDRRFRRGRRCESHKPHERLLIRSRPEELERVRLSLEPLLCTACSFQYSPSA